MHPTQPCKSELAPGCVQTKIVYDNAYSQMPSGALEFFAS